MAQEGVEIHVRGQSLVHFVAFQALGVAFGYITSLLLDNPLLWTLYPMFVTSMNTQGSCSTLKTEYSHPRCKS